MTSLDDLRHVANVHIFKDDSPEKRRHFHIIAILFYLVPTDFFTSI